MVVNKQFNTAHFYSFYQLNKSATKSIMSQFIKYQCSISYSARTVVLPLCSVQFIFRVGSFGRGSRTKNNSKNPLRVPTSTNLSLCITTHSLTWTPQRCRRDCHTNNARQTSQFIISTKTTFKSNTCVLWPAGWCQSPQRKKLASILDKSKNRILEAIPVLRQTWRDYKAENKVCFWLP